MILSTTTLLSFFAAAQVGGDWSEVFSSSSPVHYQNRHGAADFTQLTAIPSKSHLAGFFPVGLMERSGICPTGKSSKFRRS